jgi:hypothetical protein
VAEDAGGDPRLRPRVDPSDVVQEAQLDAFRRLADYLQRRPVPFRLWLRKPVGDYRGVMVQTSMTHLSDIGDRTSATILVAEDAGRNRRFQRRTQLASPPYFAG